MAPPLSSLAQRRLSSRAPVAQDKLQREAPLCHPERHFVTLSLSKGVVRDDEGDLCSPFCASEDMKTKIGADFFVWSI